MSKITCSRVQEQLGAMLDEELSVSISAELEAHVGDCRSCSDGLASHETYQKAATELRMHQPTPTPEMLKNYSAIISKAALQEGKNTRSLLPRVVVGLGIAAAIVFAIALNGSRSDFGGGASIDSAVAIHQHALPPDIRVEATEAISGQLVNSTSGAEFRQRVSDYYREKVKFRARPISLPNARMVGTRFVALPDGEGAAAFTYKSRSGSRFTVMQSRQFESETERLRVVRGYPVAQFRQNGLSYVVIGDVEKSQMQTLVQSLKRKSR